MAEKQKILIVDDDENIAELISLYLIKECFDTKIVHDGEMAIVQYKDYRPKPDIARSDAPGHRRLWGMPRSAQRFKGADYYALGKRGGF